jgi:predicted nuclease of restriction endonuclease-like (RecB) superfamily
MRDGKNSIAKPAGAYADLLRILKERIRTAQVRASLSANRELVLLYWQVGREILSRQASEHWGAKVIDRLAADLRHEFPEMRGLSPRNLKYMRAFAEAYPDAQFVQQAVAQIPWGHNVRHEEAYRRFRVQAHGVPAEEAAGQTADDCGTGSGAESG